MKPRAIVLSGRICSGKSTLADNLVAGTGAVLTKSKEILIQRANRALSTRAALQRAASKLERETDGRWLSDALNRSLVSQSTTPSVVLDSVQTAKQVHFLRQGGWTVMHVHLTASDQTLAARFQTMNLEGSPQAYAEIAKSKNERAIDKLAEMADVVIDTDRCSAADVYARIVARTEVRPATAVPLVDVLVGGQYGSEGKGNIANYLAPEYDILVRVGGPNAGHVVFRSGESPYTFRQLPSGTIANRNAMLVIGAGAVISRDDLLREIAELSVSYEKLIVDSQAMIIDEQDEEWEVENLKQQIGSTAQGVGRATARKILHRRPDTDVKLARDIPQLRHYVRDSVDFFAQAVSNGKKILLEGTQGTSLSIHHGHYPHVTSRVTTAAGCLAEAGISARHTRRVVMVCRTYPIRVGNSEAGNTSGYMSREITKEEISRRSGVPVEEIQSTEKGSVSKRPRRIAEFDWAQLRRSLMLNGPTDIALTFVDYFDIRNREAYRFEQLSPETLRFVEEMEKVSGIPVSMLSTAFNDRNIIDRRMW